MYFLILIAFFTAQPIVDEDVLEPSIQNEVDHALSLAPEFDDLDIYFPTNDYFGTNGLSKTEIALKLVSSQKAGGRWFIGTNDVTRAAVDILQSL